jgi:hypothetical protein
MAFTMLEIAIALAVIAFALVAIIGVLPTGLNVQKDNREDTLANFELPYMMELIRNGARGDDLLVGGHVEYVNVIVSSRPDGALPHDVISEGRPGRSDLAIGLLSLPKYSRYKGQYVVRVEAGMIAMSGVATELFTRRMREEMGFKYLLISEVIPFPLSSDLALGHGDGFVLDEERQARASSLQTNLHEVRLTMRWPRLPNDRLGRSRQVFRTMVGGQQTSTNINGLDVAFFEPQQYRFVQAP